MEVVIDGRGGWTRGSAGSTLAAVLETVRKALGGRRIVLIVLDGEELTRERESALGARNSDDFSMLEMRTIDSGVLGRETLKGIAAHLANLERAHQEAAKLIEAAEYGRATERLTECYGGWDTLSRAVRDAAFIAGTELKSIDLGPYRADELVRKLNQSLMRVRGAMEFRDVMRLSELAEQELKPALADWRKLVDALTKRLSA